MSPSDHANEHADYANHLAAQERALLESVLSCAVIGGAGTVRASLRVFIERTGADELMITSQIYDHATRLRCYVISAEIFSATH